MQQLLKIYHPIILDLESQRDHIVIVVMKWR